MSAGPVPSTPQPQQRSITLYEAPAGRPPASTSIEDEGDVEPARPLGVKLPERAIVHVHGRSSCSGVLVTPSLVITSRRCAPDEAGGAPTAWRVQVAATTLTWTSRSVARVLVPSCDAPVVALVLAEASPVADVLPLGTTPGPGSRLRMLGFGRCSVRQEAGIVSAREDAILAIEGPMCSGDVGGAVLDGKGALVGILAGAGHVAGDQDHAGDALPRHRTEAMRADGTLVRRMIDAARGQAPTGGRVACD